jgi:hypothetical protein
MFDSKPPEVPARLVWTLYVPSQCEHSINSYHTTSQRDHRRITVKRKADPILGWEYRGT